MRIMKLAFFVHRYYPSIGGTQILAYELARRLCKLGYEVTVFTTLDKDTKVYEVIDGVRICRYPRVKIPYITYPWNLSPLMFNIMFSSKMSDYHITHGFGYITFQSLLACLLKFKFKKPFIITAQYHPWRGLYPKTIGRKVLKLADVIIAQCSWEEKKLRTLVHHEKRIIVIPTGVNKEEFEQLPSKSRAREELELPDKAKVILYVGAVSGHKRVLQFIKLFSNYLKKHDDIFLLIVGKDAHKLKSDILVKHLEKMHKIRIKTMVSRSYVLKAYASADIYVNPSEHESFGISVLEAAASGLPIISTDTGVAPDIVVDEFNGYLISVKNFKMFISKVINALKNLEEFSNRAKVMKLKVLKIYDWNRIVERYSEVYQSLCFH